MYTIRLAPREANEDSRASISGTFLTRTDFGRERDRPPHGAGDRRGGGLDADHACLHQHDGDPDRAADVLATLVSVPTGARHPPARALLHHVASLLANAEVEGERIREWALLSYFVLLIVAGNETTRNATSGGLLALMENRDELAKLRRAPGLVNSAVEEIVRWVSPVIQFCRTPTEDVEISGVTIPAGEACCFFYPSANRDEDVFDDPFSFRIDRAPNDHFAFGIGVHFCLGANLARLELQEIFRRLVPRLGEVELAGPVERMRSSFVGGIKRMPLRLRLAS